MSTAAERQEKIDREAFESWFNSNGQINLRKSRLDDPNYELQCGQEAWEAWMAATQHQRKITGSFRYAIGRSYATQEVKDDPSKDEIRAKAVLSKHGVCVKCRFRPATVDYNGHGHWVCDTCNDRLNNEFDEEFA